MTIKHSPDSAPLDPALSSFDSLPDSAHVRVPVVAALHGVSVVTVWRWARSGKLPKPIKRGGVTAWQVGQLRRSMTPV
jgi:predicted DNA-binding transcriptional regulator AlpA